MRPACQFHLTKYLTRSLLRSANNYLDTSSSFRNENRERDIPYVKGKNQKKCDEIIEVCAKRSLFCFDLFNPLCKSFQKMPTVIFTKQSFENGICRLIFKGTYVWCRGETFLNSKAAENECSFL